MAGGCNINIVCKDPSNTCNPDCVLGQDSNCNIQCTFNGADSSKSQFAGVDYIDQQNANVGLLSSRGSRYCSGAFINNADRKQYVLTANHCGVGSSDLIQQGFWNPDCTSSSDTAGNTANTAGKIKVLSSNARIDHALLEIGDAIPASWNVFLAGFDSSSSPAASAVGVHHPSGANMKISHCDVPLVQSSWTSGGEQDHWRVTRWSEATTEPGSSGSPLYDGATKRIVGQLHGGSASCPSFYGYDEYGAISFSYSHMSQYLGSASSMDGRPLFD
jgi:V8-like Glu-specific endopeptidase